MKKKYNVEIVETKTGKVQAVIGENLTEEKAEKRIETGLTRINTEDYFVRKVEI